MSISPALAKVRQGEACSGVAAPAKFRLLYVLPLTPYFAGIEHVVHEVSDQLAVEYGDAVDINVLSCFDYQELKGRKVNYKTHYINATRLRNFFFPALFFFLNNQFDMIVVPQCELSVVCWAATRFGNKRALFVTHLHGNPKVEEAGSPTLFRLYRTFVAPKSAAMLAVSESLAAFALRSLAAGTPVYFVPNPVRQFADTERCNVGGSGPTYVSVGRLSRQKGQDILLEAFAKVSASQRDAKLVLVGGGPEEGALKRLAAGLGIADRVTFAGHVPDPTPYLKSSDCFVLASRWEGFPLVMAEAMSFGLPLVVTDCEFGPRDLVSDRRLGRVAKSGDVDDLAAAMIASSAEAASGDLQSFRREQARRFAPVVVVHEHFRVLREIASNSLMRGTMAPKRWAGMLRGR